MKTLYLMEVDGEGLPTFTGDQIGAMMEEIEQTPRYYTPIYSHGVRFKYEPCEGRYGTR